MKGSGRGASGGEEAAWRDLIANYTAEPEADGGEMPWPERENLPGPRRAGVLPDPGPETDPSLTLDLGDDTDPALDLGADPAGPPDPGPAAGPASRPSPGRPGVPGGNGPPASTANGPAVNGPAAHGPRFHRPQRRPRTRRTRPRRPAADRPPGQLRARRPPRRRMRTSCRRSRRRCPRSTRWPREPGPRCSVVPATCCWPPWWAGRSRGGPRSWPWPRSSAASRPWSSGWARNHPRDSGPDDGAVL